MKKNEGRKTIQEIVILGKRIRVGRENNGHVCHEKGAKRKYTRCEMPRIRWTTALHRSFLRAMEQLGGPHKASPKQLIDLMGVEDLTHSQVKSHLQMFRNTIKLGQNEQDYQGPLVCPHLDCLNHWPQLSIRSDVLSHSTIRGEETKRMVQGSFLMRDSKEIIACLPEEACSTLQDSQYNRNTTSHEFGHKLQLQKPTYNFPELHAGLLLEDGEQPQVITSDKLEEEADSNLFSNGKYEKQKGWPRFTTSIDDNTPSFQIALNLTL